MPTQYEAKEHVWYINLTDESKGGGCFHAEVVSQNGEKVKLKVTDPAFTLPKKDVEAAADKENEKKELFTSYAAQRDSDFPEETGYDDMVRLRYLNDGELNRNINLLFDKDLTYCYCGNTCVAINAFYDWKGFPKPLFNASLLSESALAEAEKTYDGSQGDLANRAKLEFAAPHEGGFMKPGHSSADPDWNRHLIPWNERGQVYNCFSQEEMERYVGSNAEGKKPHIYSMVEEAYRNLFDDAPRSKAKDQSIIITGESGAGKTFNTYKVLGYIDTINSTKLKERGASATNSITKKIKKTMPIMDAFGNATMPRNNDSSRFGKLIKLWFSSMTQEITGADVTPYLLEKSRCCTQQSWERNFHIFYQLISAHEAGAFDGSALFLKKKHEYRMLNSLFDKPCTAALAGKETPPGINEGKLFCQFNICSKVDYESKGVIEVVLDNAMEVSNFVELQEALTSHGFSSEEQMDLWKIVSALLLLGNLETEPSGNSWHYKDETILTKAAQLLSLDESKLIHAMKNTKRGDREFKTGEARVANSNLESLIRTIYNDLFVNIINTFSARLLAPDEECGTEGGGDTFLGVLDIFGFEFYEKDDLLAKKGAEEKVINGFEQFCINLTNEKLQKHFVDCVFGLEIQQYADQGLEVTRDDFDFIPNDYTLECLEGNKSVISKLDECIKNPSNLKPDGKGEKWLLDAYGQTFRGQSKVIKGRKIDAPIRNTVVKDKYEGAEWGFGGFYIKHYAAEVLYDPFEWGPKNHDKLDALAYEAIMTSEMIKKDNSALALFATQRDPEATAKNANGTARPSTLASAFKQDLHTLLSVLGETYSSFVRCLKPNKHKVHASAASTKKVDGEQISPYTPALILNQLQYTGMLDTLKIRKEGWSARMSHHDFYLRYKCIYPQCTDHMGMVDEIEKQHKFITKRVDIDDVAKGTAKTIEVFVGRQQILFKDTVERTLEAARGPMLEGHALVAESICRAISAARRFSALKSNYLKVSRDCHAFVARTIKSHAEDQPEMQKARAEMEAYMEAAKVELAHEAEEREMAAKWDKYAEDIADATFEERIQSDKAEPLSDAQIFYEKAKKLYDDLKPNLNDTDQDCWRTAQVASGMSELEASTLDSPFSGPEDLELVKQTTREVLSQYSLSAGTVDKVLKAAEVSNSDTPSIVEVNMSSNKDTTHRRPTRARFRISFRPN